jgi:hypothetical protein
MATTTGSNTSVTTFNGNYIHAFFDSGTITFSNLPA